MLRHRFFIRDPLALRLCAQRGRESEPVSSRTGLGVGLYHAAKQAAGLGYQLTLVANEPGIVCFALARQDGGAG